MFKTLTKYAGRTTAKVANTTTNIAKATPGYIGECSAQFKEEWQRGFQEEQAKRDQRKK